MQDERERALRRQAIQIMTGLPEGIQDAQRVLDLCRELLEQFVAGDGAVLTPPDRVRPLRVVEGERRP